MRSPINTSPPTSGQACGLSAITLLLPLLLLGLFSTGCFVIRGERRIKPVGPDNFVKKGRSGEDESLFYRVYNTPELKLEVGFVNDYLPARWEVFFIFNVLPLYLGKSGESAWYSYAELCIEPKASEVTFEPSRVFLIQTNTEPSQPIIVWRYCTNQTNTTNTKLVWSSNGAPVTLPITNLTLLRLKFPDRDYRFLDSPFQLSIDGLEVSGRPMSLPAAAFKYTTAIRPGYRIH
jgi:hypothetical protein